MGLRSGAAQAGAALARATKTAYFCGTDMGNNPESVATLVLRRIRRLKPGSIFTPRDLATVGSRTAVASALSRLHRDGVIAQPARGLYQIPATHPELGVLQPAPEEIARALAGSHRLKLQPSGAYAANLLGLSEQVPQRIVYLTDGTPRQVRIGRQQIVLRRTTPRNMATAGRTSGLVIQALRYLGQHHADRAIIEKLRRRLGPKERAELLKDAPLAPVWIGDLMRQIAGPAER